MKRKAKEFATEEALGQYLKKHPDADRKNHSVASSRGETPKWTSALKAKSKAMLSKLKNFVVGEAKGEVSYWKDGAKAIGDLLKRKDLTPEKRRALAKVALTETISALTTIELPFPLGFLCKTGIAAIRSKILNRILARVFPSGKKGSKQEWTPDRLQTEVLSAVELELKKWVDQQTAAVPKQARFEQVSDAFSKYELALEKMQASYDAALELKPIGPILFGNVLARMQILWRALWLNGREITKWAVETRQIPASSAKKFEMASRLWMATMRPPRDMEAWWRKNGASAKFFATVKTWAEIVEGGDEQFSLGPFRVKDTVHLAPAKLERVKSCLLKASEKLRLSSRDLARVLYGDVHIVGQLRKSNTIAWYYIGDDALYVRPLLTNDAEDMHNVLHELGHRYWFKFMTGSAKSAWGEYYKKLSRAGDYNNHIPGVGDVFPVRLKGVPGKAVVSKIENGNFYFHGTKGFLSIAQVLNVVKEVARRSAFPTNYASVSEEEHFAEEFAMYALGTLEPGASSEFERIVL